MSNYQQRRQKQQEKNSDEKKSGQSDIKMKGSKDSPEWKRENPSRNREKDR